MYTDDLLIRAQPLGGQWEMLGGGRMPGIVPESVQASANELGSDQLTFDLRRDPGALSNDLLPYTPIDLEIGGQLRWTGRVKAPLGNEDNPGLNVQCEGWQYHLDDDAYLADYVHTDLSDFSDMRGFADSTLGTGQLPSAGQVIADNQAITLLAPAGTVLAANSHVGVRLDLGPSRTTKRVVLGWASSNNNASFQLYFRGSNSTGDDTLSGTLADQETVPGFPITNTAGASGTTAGTFTTARRYVFLFLYCGAGATPAADVWFKLLSIQLFTSTAYESGNTSILKGDAVLKDMLAQVCPLLSTDLTQIAAQATSLPAFWLDDKTAREVAAAVNQYYGNVLQVDVLQRLVFAAFQTAPEIEVGAWGGTTFQDAAPSDSSQINDKAIVGGTGPDGTKLREVRTQTQTYITGRGFHKTALYNPNTPLTTAFADTLGDIYLANHKRTQLAGTLNVTGRSACRTPLTGATLPPDALLTRTQRLIRLANRIDPDTGALGQDGLIKNVSYSHATRSATVAIDDQRDNLSALVTRFGAQLGGT